MANASKPPVCAVVGVGPGNGEAFARRFAADGYALALIARRTQLTAKLAAELPRAKSYASDVADEASVEAAFAAIRTDLGDVDVIIHNAGSGGGSEKAVGKKAGDAGERLAGRGLERVYFLLRHRAHRAGTASQPRPEAQGCTSNVCKIGASRPYFLACARSQATTSLWIYLSWFSGDKE